MMAYIKTDDTGRVTAAAYLPYHCGDGEVYVEIPRDFAEPVQDWVLEDGVLVYDPLPVEKTPADQMEVLQQENALLKAQVQALSDRGEFIEDCIAEMAQVVYGA